MDTDKIVDIATVSPQRTILQSHPDQPKATSTLYLSRSTTANADGGQHHTIAGVHIVLAEGGANNLWKEFHVDREAHTLSSMQQKKNDQKFLMATRSLTICCDTLEVHGEFCVPEADVTIFARRLVWATPDAAINTSPLAWDVPKAPNAARPKAGQNGANGRAAGSLQVFVSGIESGDGAGPRLKAAGGVGQDPGAGQDGQAGASKPSFGRDTWVAADSITKVKNTLSLKFSPDAVYVDCQWKGPTGVLPLGDQSRGVDSFPTNGTNAVAPGVPGDGGDGGTLTTNAQAAVASFVNPAGAAGNKERDRPGGRAGTPTKCAKYKLRIKYWPFKETNKPDYNLKKTASNTTKAGAGATAKPAPNGPGTAPPPTTIECANAWLHPLSLQTVLNYARDAFLAGDHDGVQQLLEGYEMGLALPMPTGTTGWDTCPWDTASPAQWTAAQTEVASALQRLRGHLDYFGNPAGFTPLLSLQGAIKLYAGETQRALRTMLLVDWVESETREAEAAVAVFEDLISGLNDDSAKAAAQVMAAEEKIGKLNSGLETLQRDLERKGNELEAKRTELLAEAKTKKQQEANIKFSIKMAGALCQIIPVGQPALGAVGSLAGVSADLIGSDMDSSPDTVSKIGDAAGKAIAASKKTVEAKKKAEKAKKDSDKATEDASGWSTALDGVGPAITEMSGAIKALQVSQAEVEAEFQRLASECPGLQQLLREIRDLNDVKVALFDGLAHAFESLGDGYSRLSLNAATVVKMQEEKSKELGKIDHEATLAVRHIGARSRLTLQKYLYFMVKAYETTILEPLDDVDWTLSNITDKIKDLLKDAKGFDGALLEDKAKTLDGLFQDNINIVRQKLLEEMSTFGERSMRRTLAVSSTQTPEALDALNESGRVVIDPFRFGLVDPKTQLARLSDVELAEIGFDADGPALPSGTDLIVDLIPARIGTLRRSEALYAVHSDAPVRWNWTFSGDRPVPSPPSEASRDLLDFILGEDSDKIRQKVARPPFWSDLAIEIRYVRDMPRPERPRIVNLLFRLTCDVTPAPDRQRAFVVHPVGPSAGSVVDCSPTDLAGRGPGVGHFMRIFNDGEAVRLSVPPAESGAAFDHWQLIGADRPIVNEPEVGGIKVKTDVIANCYWVTDPEHGAMLMADMQLPRSVLSKAEAAESSKGIGAPPDVSGRRIHVEARDDASVVGYVPPDGSPDVLQDIDGWQEVNYRGVAGWVKS